MEHFWILGRMQARQIDFEAEAAHAELVQIAKQAKSRKFTFGYWLGVKLIRLGERVSGYQITLVGDM